MIHVNIGITMEDALTDTTPPPRRRYGGVLPEERQRLRRTKLIEGGIEVFGTKGFHAATVREVGARFRDTVLALGGSVHPGEVFRRFRGREPTTAALLRHAGLASGHRS